MKVERIISLIVAILVVNTGVAVVHSAFSLSYSAETEDEVYLEIYIDPSSLPVGEIIELSPEPIKINYTEEGGICATYSKDTEVSVFAEPIYERYGFVGWRRKEDAQYLDPRDPVKIKLHENTTIFAIYGEMTDMVSVDKQVLNKSSGEWEDSAEIYISEQRPVLIKFRGYINLSIASVEDIEKYKLYVVDQLPEGMVYEEESSNYPAIYNDATNTLVWYDLPPQPSITIYFNATASGKGDYINRMYAALLDKSIDIQPEDDIADIIEKLVKEAKWSMDYSEVKITRVYKLSLIIEPQGAGKVKIDPDKDKYPEGTEVNLTAEPEEGYRFDHWIIIKDGNISISRQNHLTIIMDADTKVTAVFSELKKYYLNVSCEPEEGGIVKVYPPSSDGRYYEGTVVNLTAIAKKDEGYFFDQWSGDIGNADPTNSTIKIVMDSDKDITAHFVKGFILNTFVEPEGAGEVFRDKVADYYKPGENVTLIAKPNDGYRFDHWEGVGDDADIYNRTITITMDSDKNITAVFEIQPKIVFYADENNDTLTVVSVCPEGIFWDDIEIYCYNDTDSAYIEMQGEVEVGDVIYVRESGLYGEVTVNITWRPSDTLLASYKLYIEGGAPTYYTLTVDIYPDGAGYLYIDPPGENYSGYTEIDYKENTTVTITAHHHEGYIFDHWEGVGDDADIYNRTITITMDSDKNITAVFEIQPKIVFYADENNDTLTVVSVCPEGIFWDDIEIYCYNDTDSAYIEMQGEVEVGDVIYVRESGLYGEVTVNITWRPSDTLLASFQLYIEEIAPTYYNLSIDIDPDGWGYVCILTFPTNKCYYKDVTLKFEEGATVTIEAHALGNFEFDGWFGDLNSTDNTITVTMSCDRMIVAHFREAPAPPEVTVKITRPKEGYLYIRDKEILPSIIGGKIKLPLTLVIGAITIEANVTGDVDHVNFIIGCKTNVTLYEKPFNYTWNERAIGIKKIKVEACDSEGKVLASDTITILIINLHKETAVVEGHVYRYGAKFFKKIPLAKVIAYKHTEDGWVKAKKTRSGILPLKRGYYKLKLEPGYYMIKVVARGYETGVKYINVSAGENLTIDFYLNKTATIKGKVKEKGIFGKGIKGANITAIREDGKTYTTTSKFLGFYRLNLPPGNYTIIVDATSQGYKLYNETIQVTRGFLPKIIRKNFCLEPEEE